MKRELCTLFPSRTERLLVIQIFVAPHSLNDGWTISMPCRHNTASYDTYLHNRGQTSWRVWSCQDFNWVVTICNPAGQ